MYSLLSGYLMPIPLLPAGLRDVAEVSPFRYMFSLPLELMTRTIERGELAMLMLVQVAWTIATLAVTFYVWRRGLRHYEAVGG